MKAAVRATLLAIALTGVAALATLIIDPALPGHVVAPWVSPQPRIQAIPNMCDLPKIRYSNDPDYDPPDYCKGTWWYQSWYHNSSTGDAPPPPADAPPPS